MASCKRCACGEAYLALERSSASDTEAAEKAYNAAYFAGPHTCEV